MNAMGQGSAPASLARQAHALCDAGRYGMLSTLARDPAGVPFGSLVSYAADERGRPLFLFSALAEHTDNVGADPRASLLVAEGAFPESGTALAPGAEPLALGRVTLLGRVIAVPAAEAGTAKARFLARHPEAATYLQLPDFAFYRLEVEGVRYVAGFGRMGWVAAADYAAAGS